MINVFIVGSKGIPAQYGGFETFVENLTKRKKSQTIHYFVSCMTNNADKVFEYNNATCFRIPVPKLGAFGRMVHVSISLHWVEKYIANNHNQCDTNIIYILGYRVGIFLRQHKKKFEKLGAVVVGNPDGLEWKRDKWNWFAKLILCTFEKNMIKQCDYIICDSKAILEYIVQKYPTHNEDRYQYIPYGSDIKLSTSATEELNNFLINHSITNNGFYLVVGRFVPENNFEIIIREFLLSKTNRDLLIITNVQANSFYKKLCRKLNFENDSRIKFVGTLYNDQLLRKIRENCFAYIHGHSVGGTNPSLLEALASTERNYLFDVKFNKEVALDTALYFDSSRGSLSKLIDIEESNNRTPLSQTSRIQNLVNRFSWEKVILSYENFFMGIE